MIGITTGLGIDAGIVAIPVAMIPGPLLTVAGFTAAGVKAGSIAAAIQTPTVAAGSIFSMLQSAGATAATTAWL
ncbi:hypothetical protein BROUX41_001937 [Berkeleyomyces rouxiae]|uniref:uncharacterized protein n=1 Tax=Berkeleyomyces rouxiae TaxID=2035830 RepID=UPI003B7AF021